MRYATDSVPAATRKKIERAFRRRVQRGKPFYLADLASDTGANRSYVTRTLQPILTIELNELEHAQLETPDAVQSWRVRFSTLRAFIDSSRRANRLIERWIFTHIEEIASRGENVTQKALRAVCGGQSRRLTIALHKWDAKTGLYKPARLKFHHGQGKEVILASFEAHRKAGVPFTHSTIADECGCSASLVGMYLKHVTPHIAERLVETEVTDSKGFSEWMTEYTVLAAMLNNAPRRDELIRKSARLHVEQIYREGRIPTYTELVDRGCSNRLIRPTMLEWSKKTGIPLQTVSKWKEVSLAEVLEHIDPALHILPLTFLEDPQSNRPFDQSQLRLINGVRCPSLRNICFFVMTFADRNRRKDLSFFNHLDSLMDEAGIAKYEDLDPNTFYESYHAGDTFPTHSIGKRNRLVQTLLRLIRLQNNYLRKLTPSQKANVEPFLLLGPSDTHFWKQSKLPQKETSERESRKKADVAVIHENFHLLRDVAERRVGLVTRLRNAYLQAVDAARSGGSTPFDFEIEDEVLEPGRGVVKAVFRLTLWRAKDLKTLHEEHGGARYYSQRDRDYLPDHPSEQDGYYVTYSRNNLKSDRYWFSDIVLDARDSMPSRDPTIAFNRASYFHIPRPPVSRSVVGWINALERSVPNLEFVPVHFALSSTLIGDAATQVLTKTGARAHEFLQIRLMKEHLQKIKVSDGHDVVAFHAIPKGGTEEAPYFMDERCMQSLHRWWTFQQEIGYVFATVSPAGPYGRKLKEAPYLWQLNGRHMEVLAVNGALGFTLADTPLMKPDGGKVRLTSHLLRHGFATELRSLDVPLDVLALLLKQKDVNVTDYYSKPTPLMLADYQRRIFEVRTDLTRTHRRSAKQIQIQLEEAAAKIGALAPVVGGTCTVAGSCPAQFACLGCFGNTPDPNKRDQVMEYRQHYVERAASARDSGLTHEQRKANQHIADCDDMLAEMDAISASRSSFERPLNISILKQA